MNRVLKIFHYACVFILFLLTILFIYEYKFKFERRSYIFVYKDFAILIIFVIYLLLNLYDLFCLKKHRFSSKYYISNIVGLLSIILVIGRSVFDKTIISNVGNLTVFQGYYCSNIGKQFVSSYYIYFKLIILLFIIFRFIDKESTKV